MVIESSSSPLHWGLTGIVSRLFAWLISVENLLFPYLGHMS